LADIRAASLDQTFDRLAEHGDEALGAIAVDDRPWPRRPKIGPQARNDQLGGPLHGEVKQ
jgi:hypothetical protein